ncbi:MAG: ABC transporter permease [Oscillibacter sp.]|nr:ABC transporter permease [Oscillibacter sp.]
MRFFKTIREKHPNELVLFVIFAALFILMAILSPDKFLSRGNLQNMGFQMPEFGLMALAMMPAILTGGMNLSIVTGSTLSAIIAGMFMSGAFSQANPVAGTVIGVLLIIGCSLLTGVVNGFFVGYIGVVAMLVTLGTRMVFEGLGLRLTKGGSVSGFPEPFNAIGAARIGPIPVNLIIFILMVVLSYYLLERSRWGKEVYMVGDNEVATRFSGIHTKRVLMLVYVFSGLLYGLAGVLISSRYCSAKTDYGSSYLMQAVTAVVLGGTDIMGGRGTVAGTVLAVLILQTISTGFNIYGVNRYLVNIFTGGILIAVLAVRYITGRVIDNRRIKARQSAGK